jgi:glycosyltransferase involved in cell wall biosynthesis
MPDNLPVVTVVVPTRNSIRTIRACLESVRAQQQSHLELVVVDNFSTDGTYEVAAAMADVVIRRGPERSAQRNAGLDIAAAAWVLWVDADMVLSPDCVRRALETAGTTASSAVAIPEVTVGPGFLTRCRALERSCYVDDPSLHNPRLLRRDLLLELGGFHEDMSGPEDTYLRHRLRGMGVDVALAPVLIEHDEGRLTWGDVLRKRVYYGRSIPAFVARTPGGLREQGVGTLRAFLRHRGRLARDPVHTAGMLGLRTAEAAAYLVGAASGRRDGRHG